MRLFVVVALTIFAVALADPLAQYGNVFGGSDADSVTALATDPMGSVYVAGQTKSTTAYWSGYFLIPTKRNFTAPLPFTQGGAGANGAIVFRSVPTSGSAPDWWFTITGTGETRVTDMVVDNGKLYVVGWFTYNVDLHINNTVAATFTNQFADGTSDSFLIAFDLSARTYLWHKLVGVDTSADDRTMAVAVYRSDPALTGGRIDDLIAIGGGTLNVFETSGNAASTLIFDGPEIDTGSQGFTSQGSDVASGQTNPSDRFYYAIYNQTRNGGPVTLLAYTGEQSATNRRNFINDLAFDPLGQLSMCGRWDATGAGTDKGFLYQVGRPSSGFSGFGSTGSVRVQGNSPSDGSHSFTAMAYWPGTRELAVTGYLGQASDQVEIGGADGAPALAWANATRSLFFAIFNQTGISQVARFPAVLAMTYYPAPTAQSWGSALAFSPADGAVYVAGTVNSASADQTLPASRAQDALIVKINKDGHVAWGRPLGAAYTDSGSSVAVGFSDLIGVGVPRPYVYVGGSFNGTFVALGVPAGAPIQSNPSLFPAGGVSDGFVVSVDDVDDCASNLCGVPSRSWLCVDLPSAPFCGCNLNMSGPLCSNPGWNCDASDVAYYPLLLNLCECPNPNPTANPFSTIESRFTLCAGDICDFKTRGTCLPSITGFFSSCSGLVSATEQATFGLFQSLLAACPAPSSTGYDFSAAPSAAGVSVVTLMAAAAVATLLARRH